MHTPFYTRYPLLLFICVIPIFALQDSSWSQDIKNVLQSIPDNIYFVKTISYKQSDDRKPEKYRVIMIEESDNSQALYIQWIDAKEHNEPSFLEVSEIRTLGQYITGISTQIINDGELSIYLEADSGEDPDTPYGYEIFIFDQETYTFGPASN